MSTAALYALICRKIYEESKRLGITLHTGSTAERRALIAAKNSSLLILAFFVQFGVFILEGIWFAVDIGNVRYFCSRKSTNTTDVYNFCIFSTRFDSM
jgi:hypothetical protein